MPTGDVIRRKKEKPSKRKRTKIFLSGEGPQTETRQLDKNTESPKKGTTSERKNLKGVLGAERGKGR